MSKIKEKERILKAAKEEQFVYRETPTKLAADFSAKTLQAKRDWHDIFTVLKEKKRKFQTRILCLTVMIKN